MKILLEKLNGLLTDLKKVHDGQKNEFDRIAARVKALAKSEFDSKENYSKEIEKIYSNIDNAIWGFSKKHIDSLIVVIELMIDAADLKVSKAPIKEKEATSPTLLDRVRSSIEAFVVHGHDEAKKDEVARFLENELKIVATILHEKPSLSKTIIEKFEKYSTVDFAVALWTADDEARNRKDTELKRQPRQNVIFETGFFIGKLGREKVIVLYEKGVEIPSDYRGVAFIAFAGNWKNDLRKEINAILELSARTAKQLTGLSRNN